MDNIIDNCERCKLQEIVFWNGEELLCHNCRRIENVITGDQPKKKLSIFESLWDIFFYRV
jgi:hypothetical protein